MKLTAKDLMRTEVRTVDPELSLPQLERRFLADKVSGFPVVRGGELVGIVSRSDIVRQLCVEQSLAETISDYHREVDAFQDDPHESIEEIADRVGERIEHLKVADVMVRQVLTVAPDTPLDEIAKLMLEHRIHRVPVTDAGRLVGILTTLDLVRLFADNRVEAK